MRGNKMKLKVVSNSISKLLILVSITGLLSLYSCAPEAPKLVPEPQGKVVEKVQVNGSTYAKPSKVDLLFVVDRSSSMESYQKSLSDNIEVFLNQFAQLNVDYHVGVITSDEADFCSTIFCSSSAYKFGKLQGNNKYVTPATKNGLVEIKKNILVGTDGDTNEVFLDPLMKALSPEMTKSGGDNQGFLRDDAYLAVVFITDTSDHSVALTQDVYKYVVGLKKSKNQVLGYGILIPQAVVKPICERDDYPTAKNPKKLEDFLSLLVNGGKRKNIMDLCSNTYGTELIKFSKDLVSYLTGTIYLNEHPILDTLKVYMNGIEMKSDLKSGWFYDPRMNAVIIGDNVVLDNYVGDGSGLKVSFATDAD